MKQKSSSDRGDFFTRLIPTSQTFRIIELKFGLKFSLKKILSSRAKKTENEKNKYFPVPINFKKKKSWHLWLVKVDFHPCESLAVRWFDKEFVLSLPRSRPWNTPSDLTFVQIEEVQGKHAMQQNSIPIDRKQSRITVVKWRVSADCLSKTNLNTSRIPQTANLNVIHMYTLLSTHYMSIQNTFNVHEKYIYHTTEEWGLRIIIDISVNIFSLLLQLCLEGLRGCYNEQTSGHGQSRGLRNSGRSRRNSLSRW